MTELREKLNNIVEDYNACKVLAKSVGNPSVYEGTTATANDIRAGKTAYSNGELLEGTMENNNALFETSFDSATFTTDNCSFSNLFLDTIDLRNINTDAITSWQYAFWNYKNLKRVIGFKPTKTGGLYWCFSGCTNLEEFPISEGGEFITNTGYLVSQCKKLKTINWFETKNVTSMSRMCSGCDSLTTFPLLNTQSVQIGGLTEMFMNCPNLSDESLNNIMMMCVNAVKYKNAAVGFKRLSDLGLSQEQRTRCQSLSNCQALLDAGWTLS